MNLIENFNICGLLLLMKIQFLKDIILKLFSILTLLSIPDTLLDHALVSNEINLLNNNFHLSLFFSSLCLCNHWMRYWNLFLFYIHYLFLVFLSNFIYLIFESISSIHLTVYLENVSARLNSILSYWLFHIKHILFSIKT